LHQGGKEEILLRCFEKQLLHELGYALPIDGDMKTGIEFLPNQHYYYHPKQGFSAISSILSQSLHKNDSLIKNVFSGKSLLAIKRNQWDQPEILDDVKRLLQLALAPLLHKPLYTPKILSDCYQLIKEKR